VERHTSQLESGEVYNDQGIVYTTPSPGKIRAGKRSIRFIYIGGHVTVMYTSLELDSKIIKQKLFKRMTKQEIEMLQKLSPVQSETAKRVRHCRCGNDIPKGERCYVKYIKPKGPPTPGILRFPRRINYCMICAGKELKTAQKSISLCLSDVKRYLKKHPEISNRKFLRTIKDGTALQTDPKEAL
jgi:hypothetical protein